MQSGFPRVFEHFFAKGRPVERVKVVSLNSCKKKRDSIAVINISLTCGEDLSFSSINSQGVQFEVTMISS